VQVLERKKLLSQAANAGLLSRADRAGLSLAKVGAHTLVSCSTDKPRAGPTSPMCLHDRNLPHHAPPALRREQSCWPACKPDVSAPSLGHCAVVKFGP